MSTQPTAGAIRAAKIVIAKSNGRDEDGFTLTTQELSDRESDFASIIDRETGAKELADALQSLYDEEHRDDDDPALARAREQARAALARYNGGNA